MASLVILSWIHRSARPHTGAADQAGSEVTQLLSKGPQVDSNYAVAPEPDRLTRFASLIGRIIPDALSTSIFLLVFVFGVALAMGDTVGATIDAYYRGL